MKSFCSGHTISFYSVCLNCFSSCNLSLCVLVWKRLENVVRRSSHCCCGLSLATPLPVGTASRVVPCAWALPTLWAVLFPD